MSEQHRGYHDMGGTPAGAVERTEHDNALWEKRVDAMMVLLSNTEHRLMRVDELRRAIESLGPEAYDRMSYYERWVSAITNLMLEKGVVGRAELEAKVAELKARGVGQA
jgi:Nitrile hydratase beta subunit, N-terminal